MLARDRECVGTGAAGARPADFEYCFETQSSPGCTCTHRSKILTHSLYPLHHVHIERMYISTSEKLINNSYSEHSKTIEQFILFHFMYIVFYKGAFNNYVDRILQFPQNHAIFESDSSCDKSDTFLSNILAENIALQDNLLILKSNHPNMLGKILIRVFQANWYLFLWSL